MTISSQTLFVVALPIGNPQDLSLRARQVLESVSLVAAEDTRTFERLCKQANLKVQKVVSHHEHNEKPSTEGLLARLEAGESLALVTDAGTPAVSDPGFPLVRAAMERGFRVVPIPGPSSLTTALSVSPIGGTSHFFGGFAPAQENHFKDLFRHAIHLAHKVVFFESPHRVLQQLQWAHEACGDRQVAICRELTKEFEEIKFGTLEKAIQGLQDHPPKGELVVIYQGAPGREDLLSEAETRAAILDQLGQGQSGKDILEHLKAKTCLKRQDLFDLIQELKKLD